MCIAMISSVGHIILASIRGQKEDSSQGQITSVIADLNYCRNDPVIIVINVVHVLSVMQPIFQAN